ncbi:MAG: four helix bundle protein [Defluviitaleaceae bacterium]|nr:four helix bundle protein [Defluviitaleaceae bacterium]
MKTESVVGKKSFDFAVRIVRLYKYLCDEQKEFVMSKQLLRSGTSIGANIREALHGQSKRDFASKMNIALKEANEALYWIELLSATEILPKKYSQSIWKDCNELVSILVAIVKTSKKEVGGVES